MNQPFRIIFVEGVPFTGKSTTSEYLTRQLTLNGSPARWISEGMLFQQYFPKTLAMLDQQEPFSKPAWQTEWATFAETMLAATEVLVVDSALSYVGIAPLLTADWSREEIDAALSRIAELCVPLQPRVIHLVGDVDQLVPASIVDRGAAWEEHLIRQSDTAPYQQARGRSGLEGATTMLRETQALTASILAQDAWSVLTVDVMTPNWPARRSAMIAFLGLDEIVVEPPVIQRSLLESYSGSYTPENPERAERILKVQLEDNTLILYGPRERYGPLIPLSLTRFHLQATPVDIEFLSEDGQTQSLKVFRSDGTTEICHRS